jgi:hypothetical protein
MEDIEYEVRRSKSNGSQSVSFVSWDGLKLGSQAKVLELGSVSSVSVQMSGNFGEGGAVALEGSNDGKNFLPLKSLQGRDLKKSEPGIDSLADYVRYVRPVVLSGDSQTDVNCNLCLNGR